MLSRPELSSWGSFEPSRDAVSGVVNSGSPCIGAARAMEKQPSSSAAKKNLIPRGLLEVQLDRDRSVVRVSPGF